MEAEKLVVLPVKAREPQPPQHSQIQVHGCLRQSMLHTKSQEWSKAFRAHRGVTRRDSSSVRGSVRRHICCHYIASHCTGATRTDNESGYLVMPADEDAAKLIFLSLQPGQISVQEKAESASSGKSSQGCHGFVLHLRHS